MRRTTSFLGLFAGFVLIVTGVHASCPIELNPQSVVLKHGEPVSINCSTTETIFEGLGWEATEGGKTPERVNHTTWSVGSLTVWDVSVACYINPVEESTFKQCESIASITLYTFTEHVSISSTSVVLRENSKHNFTCHIGQVAPVQNLTVRWYREDMLIRTDTFDNPTKKPMNLSTDFNFTLTRQDNGVRFRCEAHMDLGPEGPQFNLSSQEFNVTVQYGPDRPIHCSEPNIYIWEGQTLASLCPVEGNPLPAVRWMKDGNETDPHIPLKREDTGAYTMEAEGASYFKVEHQVVVMYGPELHCPSSYTAVEHTPHSLRCNASGYPQPVVTWYREGEEVELPESLSRHDAGQYTVTASIQNFTVNATVDINVTYAPSQIAELEDAEVEAGSDVFLKCSSTGNPRPQYIWSYYRTANVMQEDEDGVSRLLIHNATIFNTGSYTCKASNQEGSVSRTVRVTVTGAECPIEITPERVVVKYGTAKSVANCTQKSGNDSNVMEQQWVYGKTENKDQKLYVNTIDDWESTPVCTVVHGSNITCNKTLDLILYKHPDKVSIRTVSDLSSMVEGEKVQLHCDIFNVAPASRLHVWWYKHRGNSNRTLLENNSTDVTCPNSSKCNLKAKSPMNVSSSTNITLDRSHNGTMFTCAAQLDLGPQPSENTSSPLDITVHYKPVINETKLPKTIPVFRGYPEELVCEAYGHPLPNIQWIYSSDKVIRKSEDILIVSEAGFYNCTATNDVSTTSHVVEVILKEDYLPLIAGFVAVTVICISIVFVFIYSIYYKNTKMRRYSLKNPKLSNHNGNVAHNGWDLQFPMTKLS